MNPEISIRQAQKTDSSIIAEFIAKAACVHRHLDWQSILDWIPHAPFLLLTVNDRFQGVLACPPEPEHAAWIRCFACSQFNRLDETWHNLFAALHQEDTLSGSTLYSVGLYDWFAKILTNSNFENFQNIVVLQWVKHVIDRPRMNQPWFIRPMEEGDLEEVAILDQVAFEPIWVNPKDKIVMAYQQSEHASVAEIDGRIIAYEMTTANHFSAHLARVAVLPEFQHRYIARAIVLEMMQYFIRKGIDQITVNTQNDNSASLALYESLGFKLTGEAFPVFRYRIPAMAT